MKQFKFYFTLMVVFFCVFTGKGFAHDEIEIMIQKMLDSQVSSSSSDNIVSNMEETIAMPLKQARADCPENYSCDIEDLKPLLDTTWEFTFVNNGTPSKSTIVFTVFPTYNSSGIAALDSVYQKKYDSGTVLVSLGATFYRDLSQIMGSGYGFAASFIIGDYSIGYFFRITDNLASGVYMIDNTADEDPPSALTMTGRSISSNGDTNGDGRIGLEEAIHALQVVSGIK